MRSTRPDERVHPARAVAEPEPAVPEWLTLREVAFLTGLDPQAISAQLRDGRIRSVELLLRRRRPPLVLIRAADLVDPPPAVAAATPQPAISATPQPAIPATKPKPVPAATSPRPSMPARAPRRWRTSRALAWTAVAAGLLIAFLAFAAYATGFGFGGHPTGGSDGFAPPATLAPPVGGTAAPCAGPSCASRGGSSPAAVASPQGSQPTPASPEGSPPPATAALRVIGASSGSGDYSAGIATDMAGVTRLLVRVETAPAVPVIGRWTVTCTTSSVSQDASGGLSGNAPFTTELRIPMAGADRCTVSAEAGSGSGGSITFTFLAG